MPHRINLRNSANPNGDTISDAFSKLDQNFRELHDFVHASALPPGTYTKIIVDQDGRITTGALSTTDINAALASATSEIPVRAHLCVVPHTLPGTEGSTRSLLTLTDGTNNNNILHVHQIRHSEVGVGVGKDGWDTITTRIEMKSDNTTQGWIDFNPEHQPGAVLIGASDALKTFRKNASLLVAHDQIKIAGSLIPTESGHNLGSSNQRFESIHAKHLHGHADSASKLGKPIKLNLTGDASGNVSFDGSKDANLRLNLNAVVAPGTYSRVIVDATGRVIDGGPLSSDDIFKAIQRPGTVDTSVRIYNSRANAVGLAKIDHNIEDAFGTVIEASGFYFKDDFMMPLNLVKITKTSVEMNGATQNAPVRIMVTVLNTKMDWK